MRKPSHFIILFQHRFKMQFMKKLTILLLLSLLFFNCISQQTDSSSTLTKQDYLRKSKHMKVAAWSLLGGGVVMATAGTIIATEAVVMIIVNPFSPPANEKKLNSGATLILVGSIALLASIPFFIASSKNKRIAASMSFSNQPLPAIRTNNFVYREIPSLTLKISL